MLPWLALLGVGGALAASRTLVTRRYSRAFAARLPVGSSGIIPGAEPFERVAPGAGDGDPGPAALLVHGFGDTPQAMLPVADALHAAGWTVRAPLLPGHGRTLEEFGRSRARDWLTHARRELAALRARHRDVAIVGLSMGGAISTILAAETPGIRGLALLAPFLSMPTTMHRVARMHWLVGGALPWIAARGERSIHEEGAAARSLAYGIVTPRLLRELLDVVEETQRAIPRLTVPTLVMYSRQDNRVPVEAAERESAKLGMAEREIVWLDNCGHIVTVDREHHVVSARVTEFLTRHAGAARAGDAAPR